MDRHVKSLGPRVPLSQRPGHEDRSLNQETVDQWLSDFIKTALARDLEAHMDLISREVLVFGVPGFETLDYDDWYRQCEHEFPQGLIADIRYDRVQIRTGDQERVLFKALETTQTADGGSVTQGVELLLQREPGRWRLKQFRVLPEDEARHDGLI